MLLVVLCVVVQNFAAVQLDNNTGMLQHIATALLPNSNFCDLAMYLSIDLSNASVNCVSETRQ